MLNPDKEKSLVLNLYAAFGISLILTLIPLAVAGIISALFMLGVLIGAYIIRRKSEDHSLSANHCTFLIRTMWIGALFSLITTAIASAFMLPNIDYSPFQPCAEDLAARGQEFLTSATNQQIWDVSQPCMDAFIAENQSDLVMSALVAGGPILIYFIYRFVKGLVRAQKGYRLADPKMWF